jgi:peroxiredoxin
MSTTSAPAASPPAVGTVAPDFTLSSTSGEKVTLSAFRGQQPVLLAFFPAAFTSVCTTEMCAFSDDYDQFAEQGVAVLPISVDATPSLKAYKEQYHLKTDLLSDFRRDVSRAYGVLNEERFNSQRAYFLIDRGGIVRWAHVEVHGGFRRENAEILAEIAKL